MAPSILNINFIIIINVTEVTIMIRAHKSINWCDDRKDQYEAARGRGEEEGRRGGERRGGGREERGEEDRGKERRREEGRRGGGKEGRGGGGEEEGYEG